MGQTKNGIIKLMAKKTGISVVEYEQRRKNGIKWCYKCNAWLSETEFGKDKSRWDGRFSICRYCRHVKTRIQRKNFAPSKKRQQFVSSKVNYAIKTGKLPRPDTLPCFYCGKNAVEYHHHLGYEDAHIFDIRAACKKCHINLHWDN